MSAKKDAILAKYGVKPGRDKIPPIALTAQTGGTKGGPAPTLASVPGRNDPGKKDAILAKYGVKPGGKKAIFAKQSVTTEKGSGGGTSAPEKSNSLSDLAPTGKSEEENLRQESRLRSQLAKGVSPETLKERAKRWEGTETIEADRREAGQLGARLRLGEATDQDVTDYLGKIKENYGFVPATASLEEMLDQTQSYLRSRQPKAATYAELVAEEKDPLSRLANTAKGAAEQFGGSLAQTVSTGAKYIQPSTVVNLFRGFPARNPLMDRAVDTLLDPAKEWVVEGTQNVADRLERSGAEDIAKAQEGLNPAGRFLVNAGVGLTQMAGDAAIGAATGGGSMIPLLARSFGSGVQEARGKGYSEEEQLALGLTSAATEYFSERLFGGNPVYDEDVGLVNWLVGKVVKNPTVMKVLSSAPVETGSEGLEEIVSGLLNPVWEWAITGNQPEYKLDELIEEGALGVLTALLARGGAAVVNKVTGNGNNAGENLDTQAGERYDGSKEMKQGGLKDGRGEEAGRFDAGVEESGGRYDRETLWYQAKEADTGGGRRSEGDSAFVARVLAEGKTVEGKDQRRYAYRLTAEEDYAPVTREAMETAKEWGLAPTVVDSFEWNNGKRTFYGADAVTGSQGQVFLVNGSGKEEIAHEGLHSGLNRGIPEAKKFFELTNQLDLMGEKVNEALQDITTTYYDKLGRTFDPKKDMLRLSEEFAAFISGKIETGQAEEFFGLTEATNPEIFASWRDFKAAMGANPMPQTGLEGDGPASYSLDAFPKKPAPLVNDTTADDILRDRSAVNFLTRRGGLELKSNMTQTEKRQAVKEAVERVAGKKPDDEEIGFEIKKKDDMLQTAEEQDATTQDKNLVPVTEEEKAAVLTYKSSESYKINAKLRDGLSLTTEEQEMVAALDKALEKLPKVKGTVYRTLCFDDLSDAEGELAAFLAEHEVGSTVRYPAYTSTSIKPDGHPLADGIKYGVILEIDGESARRLNGFGNNFEREALFPRKTRFYITNVEQDADGIYHIQMKEAIENAGEREGRMGLHSEELGEDVQ